MKTSILFATLTLTLASTFLWADPDAPPVAPASAQTSALTPDQLSSLVAPIALYPDVLLSQIMVASTYPLEVVQAYQWMQQHPELTGQALTTAAQQQPWDPSVQALVAFPDVIKRLNQDVAWTTSLGNAFLANQAAVMDAVQEMRGRADQSGKLASTEQENVVKTTDNGHPVIEIQPAQPDVVYVPDYDPAWIWGDAPAYYPYPYWYYPARPAFGWCWWGGGIYMNSVFFGWNGWGGWGWHPGWHDHSIVVNRGFISVNHFNTVRVSQVNGVSVWAHSADHRLGVAYPNRALSQQYRPAGVAHVSVSQAQQQFHQASIRQANADRFGSRQIAPSVYNRNRTAFGGIEGGGAARAHSSRGYSSLGHTQGAGRSGGWTGGGSRSSGGSRGEGGGGHR